MHAAFNKYFTRIIFPLCAVLVLFIPDLRASFGITKALFLFVSVNLGFIIVLVSFAAIERRIAKSR